MRKVSSLFRSYSSSSRSRLRRLWGFISMLLWAGIKYVFRISR